MATSLLVLSLAALSIAQAFNASDYEPRFEAFLAKYARQYHNDATEKAFRLNVFATNMLTMEAKNEREKVLNDNKDRATYGMNKFTDWTDAECEPCADTNNGRPELLQRALLPAGHCLARGSLLQHPRYLAPATGHSGTQFATKANAATAGAFRQLNLFDLRSSNKGARTPAC